MAGAWSTIVGGPFGMLGGMATASFDGPSLFVAATSPVMMNGLDPAQRQARGGCRRSSTASTTSRSRAPTGSPTPPTRTGCCGRGVRQTGQLLLTRLLFRDTGSSPGSGLQGAGITIARNTVYVPAAGGCLVAYR